MEQNKHHIKGNRKRKKRKMGRKKEINKRESPYLDTFTFAHLRIIYT